MTGIQEVPDELAARRRSRVLVGAYVGLIVGAGAIGGVIGATRHPAHHHHPLRGLLVAGGVLLVCALLGAGMLYLALRRPHTRTLMAYGWRRRFRVAKQLRRGQPISTQDWPLATAIVDAGKRQKWYLWFMGAAIGFWGVDGLTEHGGQRWLHLGLAAAYLVLLPYTIRERRRIRRGYASQRARHEGPPPPSP